MTDDSKLDAALNRSDDLNVALNEVTEALSERRHGFTTGWMSSLASWAFYSQNGVVKHVVNRFAILMTKAGWDYTKSDIPFSWSTVQSDLETLRLQAAMRTATIWTFVFGGAAIFLDVDDGFQKRATKLDPKKVRSIKRLVPMSALDLRPVDGNYATAEYFEDRGRGLEKIHRSRLIIMVAADIPPSLGWTTRGFINSTTGWPPSWLEGIYESLCDWKSAERESSSILRGKALLYLQLEGLRKAAQSPDTAETEALIAYLQEVADNLTNDSLLTLEKGDELKAVDRSITGISDLLEGKRTTFVANTGTPEELVLMISKGSLGDNNGPIDAYNDVIDGMRGDMLTRVVERVTDLDLQVLRRKALLNGEVLEIPASYTIVWRPVAEPTGDQKAKERKANSDARKSDSEYVPIEVILSDPKLADDYPDLAAYLERVAEEAEQAKKMEASGAKSKTPDDDLVPAAVVAQKLGISSGTLIKMMHAGHFSGKKIASRWKFYWSEVKEWLERGESAEEVAEAEQAVDRRDRFVEIVAAHARSDDMTIHNMLAHPLMALLEESGFEAEAAALHELTLPGGESGDGELSDPYSFAWWLAGAVGTKMAVGPKPSAGLGLASESTFGSVYGASDAMREIFAVLERVSPSRLPVLILGESGTGKEGIARGIHDQGKRKGDFVAINCAALPYDHVETLDVLSIQASAADGGTLFLDEVGELGSPGQAAVLRLFGDLGDVRIVSATWQDMEPPMFRLDLRMRLAGVEVEIPPLRERGLDVVELGCMFYSTAAHDAGWPDLQEPFAPSALAAMTRYAWPGNVRELKMAVERGAMFAGSGAPILAEHLQLRTGVR